MTQPQSSQTKCSAQKARDWKTSNKSQELGAQIFAEPIPKHGRPYLNHPWQSQLVANDKLTSKDHIPGRKAMGLLSRAQQLDGERGIRLDILENLSPEIYEQIVDNILASNHGRAIPGCVYAVKCEPQCAR